MKTPVLWFNDHFGVWMVLRGGFVLYESRYYLDAYSALRRIEASA